MSPSYQVAAGLTVIARFFSWAWMSSTLVSSVSYLSTSVGRSVMFSCKTMESLKSLHRALMSTDRSLRCLISCCSDRRLLSFSMQCTSKWSDRVGSLTTIPSTRSSSIRVMIRSRVCPLEWVGVATCCFKLKDSSRLWSLVASVLLLSSRWKLKSPTINKLPELQQAARGGSRSLRETLWSATMKVGKWQRILCFRWDIQQAQPHSQRN